MKLQENRSQAELYSPCTVIKDYLSPRRVTQKEIKISYAEREAIIAKHANTYRHISPRPIWIQKFGPEYGKNISSAQSTRDAVNVFSQQLKDESETQVNDATIEAFKSIQESEFDLSDCGLRSVFNANPEGVNRMEKIFSHNLQVATEYTQAMDDYLREWKQSGQKYNTIKTQEISEARDRRLETYNYTRFSRIGINRTEDQALFFVSTTCGSLCGGGYYILMSLVDQKWELQSRVMFWVS